MHHPGFKEFASKLSVKRFAEITQHEVAAEDLFAWLGEQRTGSLIVALPARLVCTLQLLLHLGVDYPKLVLGLHSGQFMVDQGPESSGLLVAGAVEEHVMAEYGEERRFPCG